MTDAEMLAQFVQSRSPETFGHVVGRHVHLVYSACLRQLREPVLADQATQVDRPVLLWLVRRTFVRLATEDLGWNLGRAPRVHLWQAGLSRDSVDCCQA